LAAKEHDELRFRAPGAFNDIIRALAAEHGAKVVETQQALEDASPNGLVGRDMMLEHLHPTITGYRVLGSAFFMGLAGNQFGQDLGLRWAWDAALAQSRRLTPVPGIDSLAGAYRVQQLTASWPFQPIGSRLTRIDTLMAGTLEGDLGLKLFRDDVPRIEALDAVRRHAIENGDLATASINLEAVIQSYPMVPGPHLALAKIRMQEGRFAEAETLVREELTIGDNAEAFQIAGTLALNGRQITAAIPLLERAVALNPADLRARYNLAGAYALQQRYDEARAQAEEIIRRNPAAEDARRLLGSLPR
jgi:tetratricopeptide (TPR) repeat protein